VTEPTTLGQEAVDHRAARWVAVATGSGVMLQTIDSSATAMALPAIGRAMGVAPLNASLTIVAYLIGVASIVPLGGWLGDRFSGRNVFRVAIAMTMVAAVACTLAPSMPVLVAARLFGGMSAAVLLPVGRLLVLRSTTREQRVDALSTFSTLALLGPLLGPAIGGVLTDLVGWRAIFLVNIPLGLFAFIAVTRFVERGQELHSPPAIDLVGIVLAAVGTASVAAGIELLGHGRAAEMAGGLCLLGALLLAALTVHSRRRTGGLLDLELLKKRTLKVSMIVECNLRLLIGSAPLLTALLLQTGLGLSASAAGLVMLAYPLGSMVAKALVAPVYDRFGFRNGMAGGVAVSAITFAALAGLSGSGVAILGGVLLFVHGMARSLTLSATTVLAFEEIAPHAMGQATSMTSILQQIFMVLGVGSASALLQSIAGQSSDLFALRVATLAFGIITALPLITLARMPANLGRESRQVA
jgi:MFS family permease